MQVKKLDVVLREESWTDQDLSYGVEIDKLYVQASFSHLLRCTYRPHFLQSYSFVYFSPLETLEVMCEIRYQNVGSSEEKWKQCQRSSLSTQSLEGACTAGLKTVTNYQNNYGEKQNTWRQQPTTKTTMESEGQEQGEQNSWSAPREARLCKVIGSAPLVKHIRSQVSHV